MLAIYKLSQVGLYAVTRKIDLNRAVSVYQRRGSNPRSRACEARVLTTRRHWHNSVVLAIYKLSQVGLYAVSCVHIRQVFLLHSGISYVSSVIDHAPKGHARSILIALFSVYQRRGSNPWSRACEARVLITREHWHNSVELEIYKLSQVGLYAVSCVHIRKVFYCTAVHHTFLV